MCENIQVMNEFGMCVCVSLSHTRQIYNWFLCNDPMCIQTKRTRNFPYTFLRSVVSLSFLIRIFVRLAIGSFHSFCFSCALAASHYTHTRARSDYIFSRFCQYYSSFNCHLGFNLCECLTRFENVCALLIGKMVLGGIQMKISPTYVRIYAGMHA